MLELHAGELEKVLQVLTPLDDAVVLCDLDLVRGRVRGRVRASSQGQGQG